MKKEERKLFFKKNKLAIILGAAAIIGSVGAVFYVDYHYETSIFDCKATRCVINAEVDANGDLTMEKRLTLETKWVSYYEGIYYKVDDLQLDYQSSYIPTLDLSYHSIEVLGPSDEVLIPCTESSSDYSALKFGTASSGSTNYYVGFGCNGDKDDLNDPIYRVNGTFTEIFAHSKKGWDKGTTFIYRWKVKDAARLFTDTAELNWVFTTNNDMLTKNVEVNITLPNTITNKPVVYGHGCFGEVHQDGDANKIQLTCSRLRQGEEVEARILFDKEALTGVSTSDGNYTNVNHLEKANNYEQKLISASNNQGLLTYAAYGLTAIIVLIAIAKLISIYVKFDKEFKPDYLDEYYREIPNTYGPGVANYMYYWKEPNTNAFMATFMELIRKKYLVVDYFGTELTSKDANYKIFFNAEMDVRNLSPEEYQAYLIIKEVIAENKDYFFMHDIDAVCSHPGRAEHYTRAIDQWGRQFVGLQASQYNYFTNPADAKKKASFPILLCVLGGIGLGIIYKLVSNTLLFVCIGVLVALLLFLCSYPGSIMKRTQAGANDNARWEAFIKFMKDFSKFDDLPIPMVELWDQYLVYATTFGIADLVEEQMKLKCKALKIDPYEHYRDSYFYRDRRFCYCYYHHYGHSYHHAHETVKVEKARIAALEASRRSSSSVSGSHGGFSGGSSHGGGGSHGRGH